MPNICYYNILYIFKKLNKRIILKMRAFKVIKLYKHHYNSDKLVKELTFKQI